MPEDVRHVEIPKGVTVIGKNAFRNCSNLQSVTIPDSVTEIGIGAFYECSELQFVVIPDSVTKIGNNAFESCSALQSVTIPDGVTKIGRNTFWGCSALQSVTIPDSVTKIGPGAFSGCSALQSVTIPDSITEIGNSAFYGCTVLQSATIPDSVTKIDDRTFQGCSALQSVTIPDGVTEIGRNTFWGCSALQSVTIPDSITEIGDGAFRDCISLQSITIPDSVTEIGKQAFRNCSRLRSVTLPDGVTKIGDGAFRNCYELQSVNIPDSVTIIHGSAFAGCHKLRSVIIPDGVTDIGEYAFYDCAALQSVTIPDGITEISDNAFRECSGLRSITIPDSVTYIGDGSFARCPGLQTITIPDSVTEIADSAFRHCSNLQSVTIPDGIATIGQNVFADCPALQSVMYKGINIAPYINIDGYGVNTFDVIRELIDCDVPLNTNTVKFGIDMEHQGRLSEWIRNYPVFGEMRILLNIQAVIGKTEEYLRRCFEAKKKTGHHVPKILRELAMTARICGIPPERLAETFDIRYTETLIRDRIPIVPAEACRCYYDRGTCDMLIRKGKISVMAEAISLYNKSGYQYAADRAEEMPRQIGTTSIQVRRDRTHTEHLTEFIRSYQECYRHLMEFIRSHPDTGTEDLLYAVDHATEIPIRADTTLTQVRQHRTYTESLTEVTKIEEEYGKIVPGFKLSDYPCNIDPVGITYNGMTARVLDLSDSKDIALAARLGELTNCCQCFGSAGETAMMHGFLNPDAGFWVIEDKDGKVRAQAEIWEANPDTLVFDNIEFADTDDGHRAERINQLRGVIATWAMESGYKNIIMGCGYNEFGTKNMERAPIPELRLTPEEVFMSPEGSYAEVFFDDIDDAEEYMQTEKYRPDDFVYTDTDERCVYIKKNGTVSDYLMEGYDRSSAENRCPQECEPEKNRSEEPACR